MIRRLLPLLLLLALLPTSAAAAQPPQLAFFGMNTYITGQERLGNDRDDGIATIVAAGRTAGASWAREEISWANLESERKGRWNWANMDRRIAQLAAAGYGITGMLLTTPAWARVSDCGARARAAATQTYWCPPASARDYSDFVWTVVERYDGDGVMDAPGSPRVAAWQIWNEPSAPLTWPGSPAEYGALLVEGYKAAKSADPSAIVATGGVYLFDGLGTDPTDGLHFFDAMIRTVPESRDSFDALAIHPYMTSAAPDAPKIHASITLWGRILTAQRWLAANLRRGERAPRPLWISELGWAACTCGQCPPAAVANEQLVATYLARAHLIALALGVQQLSYFQLEDKFDGRDAGACDDASAILGTRADGYRQKPAFVAYRALVGVLGDAQFVGFGAAHRYPFNPRDQNYIGLYHLRFATPGATGTTVDALWRTSGSAEVTLPLGGRRAELIAWDGTVTPLSGTSAKIAVGEQPQYIRVWK